MINLQIAIQTWKKYLMTHNLTMRWTFDLVMVITSRDKTYYDWSFFFRKQNRGLYSLQSQVYFTHKVTLHKLRKERKLEFLLSIMLSVEVFDAPVKWNPERYILRGQLSLFPCSFFLRLVPQHNSISETLKHYYITKRICESKSW